MQTIVQPLEKEEFKLMFTLRHGVMLGRYLNPKMLGPVANELGRSLTTNERCLFVNFEWDNGPDKPLMYKCHSCGESLPGVWWKIPTMEFSRRLKEAIFDKQEAEGEVTDLEKTKILRETLEKFPLPEFGCHYMDSKNPLDNPHSYCGPSFPGTIGTTTEFDVSCLRFHATNDEELKGIDVIWGMRLSTIRKEQERIRQENETKKANKAREADILAEWNQTRQGKLDRRVSRNATPSTPDPKPAQQPVPDVNEQLLTKRSKKLELLRSQKAA